MSEDESLYKRQFNTAHPGDFQQRPALKHARYTRFCTVHGVHLTEDIREQCGHCVLEMHKRIEPLPDPVNVMLWQGHVAGLKEPER